MKAFFVLVLSAISLSCAPTEAADLVLPDGWKENGLITVGKYEGKGYGQVTPDTDCQGLSLGIEQSTVVAGSLLKMITFMAPAAFTQSVDTHMPASKDAFLKVVDLLREAAALTGPNADELRKKKRLEAREASLALQIVKPTNKCAGNHMGTAMKETAGAEIQAWLTSPVVKDAQRKYADQKLVSAFRTGECFLRANDSASDFEFRHFLFFYGFIVQAGERGLSDRSLELATSWSREFGSYSIDSKENVRRKAAYLADWLNVAWSNVANPAYYVDAKKNAALLMSLTAQITPLDVHMLFLRHVRAITGNTPYQIIFMERGIIDLLGRGWVNSTPFDHSSLFASLGKATPPQRAAVACG